MNYQPLSPNSLLIKKLKRTFFLKKKEDNHHHSARGFPLLGLNFNKGSIIVSGIEQLFKAKEAMHLHAN